jgi:hypothetical protein
VRSLAIGLAALSMITLTSCAGSDGDIRIDAVRLEEDGAELRAVLSVHNGSVFPIYLYESPRRLLWDDAAKRMTVVMKETECPAPGSLICAHYYFPAYTKVGAGDEEVRVRLSRGITKGVTPEHLVAEVAWADEPVRGTEPGQDPRAAVVAAEREILVAEWRR